LNRQFPSRVRADLQLSLEAVLSSEDLSVRFEGVRFDYLPGGLQLSTLLLPDALDQSVAVVGPATYEEVDVGEEAPVRCLRNGLWLVERGALKAAVLVAQPEEYMSRATLLVEVAVPPGEAGEAFAGELFDALEEGVKRSACYRGKVLSLEHEDAYSGQSRGMKVHHLRAVERSEVILPEETLELLERNVLRFVEQRDRLVAMRQSAKKGLLLHGPPGTGKTHTIHFLLHALEGHTAFLLTGEQMGLLDQYLTLARLLAPSVVVFEDVDLVATGRDMQSSCEQVLLSQLLNEMDGLREDSPILFLLTTNRPEVLEPALATRPGRIDQAVEFKLPDKEARERLVALYGGDLDIAPELATDLAQRTEGASPAFIKELLRKAAQFAIERDRAPAVEREDVDDALEEILRLGGGMSARLLGSRVGFA
jgi:DNA replication protein DnaC